MYQADPSVIISGNLADKEKLFPSANIIMFLVLNEEALVDLSHDSASLVRLHSQLRKETPVIICSEFSKYQELEHAARETKQLLLLPERYDYLKANKFIANFYDIKKEDLPGIVMVDAKKNNNMKYLQRDKFTSIHALLTLVNDIASHFISSPSMTYQEFKNDQSAKFNFRSRSNPTNMEINGIFNLFIASLFDKNNKGLVYGLIADKLKKPVVQSSAKLSHVVKSIGDLFSREFNQHPKINTNLEYFNDHFPHHILDSAKSGLNSFSQNIVGSAYKVAQTLFNIDEDDDPATFYAACATPLRTIIETELHASHLAYLRREKGIDIENYYLTWDEKIGPIKHLNVRKGQTHKLDFPTNGLMYTQYQKITGENQDIFAKTLRHFNEGAVHQNYVGQFEDSALDFSSAMVRDWSNLAACIDKCVKIRQSKELNHIYQTYKFQHLTTSADDNM